MSTLDIAEEKSQRYSIEEAVSGRRTGWSESAHYALVCDGGLLRNETQIYSKDTMNQIIKPFLYYVNIIIQ